MRSPKSRFSLPTELRNRHCTAIRPPDETTRARFVDVCTSPFIDGLIRTTPFGHPCTARISRRCVSVSISEAGRAVSSAVTLTPSSTPRSSSRTVRSKSRTDSRNAPASAAGTVTTARASRGIALRSPPPSTLDRRRPNAFSAILSKRNRTRFALPRSSTISMPEWPPLSPFTSTRKAVEEAGTDSSS